MSLRIRPVDPASDADLVQLGALLEAGQRHDYGASVRRTPAQRRVGLESTPYWDVSCWAAFAETMEGGEVLVGVADTMIPLAEDLDQIHLSVEVHPAHRGQGVGTALVEEALIPAIRAAGRPLATAYGSIPADGDVDDPALPANRLAARVGLERRNVAVCRVLDLPVPPALLAHLEAEAVSRMDGYTILTWEDEVPAEHVERYGALLRQLEIDEPDEDVEHEAPEYTPERIRIMEERRRRAGTHVLAAVAVAPDGSFAGNSEIGYASLPGTDLGYQENTLVMPEHRGHRLGLALKVANHLRLAERAPALRALVTWNSHVNPWMIAINEQLGYRVAFREIAYQGRSRT
ncbi:GNAT family N-acetyltransferase [Brachybacterium huguangmaarense]|uniref:GNAT family N-acetyltransferase n=1 Tax=Brachybacterium huguangmaarense TaxID=1652028 RepID=A0ABY6G4C8_9MICO|nr:GNAT family N-acetyltransferase [Brachybacterium huguangmaarense]UYG17814.1 GNAT family N-acetyltransferase [Brachybacterium huguangmaarense]